MSDQEKLLRLLQADNGLPQFFALMQTAHAPILQAFTEPISWDDETHFPIITEEHFLASALRTLDHADQYALLVGLLALTGQLQGATVFATARMLRLLPWAASGVQTLYLSAVPSDASVVTQVATLEHLVLFGPTESITRLDLSPLTRLKHLTLLLSLIHI